MSWPIIENYRRRLQAEQGLSPKNWGGKLTVCLVYPHHYRTAMSNLGFQAVYALLNRYPDVVCERAFLPDREEMGIYVKTGSPLLSLESQRPLTDFDIVAFSISFESDYLTVPVIFRLTAIPAFSADRDASHPLVVAGGAALFLNPEPVADFMDLIGIGEAEAVLPGLLTLLRSDAAMEREDLLGAAAGLPGIYVPSGYTVAYQGPGIVGRQSLPGYPTRVSRVWASDLDRDLTASEVLTPATEFGDMYLLEVSRGCPRGCRFCAAGFIYLPYRPRSLEVLKAAAVRGLSRRDRIGLVGAAVSDLKGIGDLCRHIVDHGGKVSVSSLRIDALDDSMIEVLKKSGHKTVALAPEGGSQRLRDLIRKGIDEEQILRACDLLIGHDILNLKLYFIIGLPTETMDDLEEMALLVNQIRERVVSAARKNRRLGDVVLSVNPFIPKPFTPFQWCGMEEQKSLERKSRFLHQVVGKLSNVRLQIESPKDAYLQALLSRGDRRLSELLVKAAEVGSWRRGAKELEIETDDLVYRHIPLNEPLPWDIIEGVDRSRLTSEYHRSFGGD